ncbi:hypothetical protein [Acidithiobacillus thiooxidans]|uniref:Uncharacterized protein n=1 Tax=Acidithiobacillus thiooxidans TaxID=930 RepID=A0A1C2ITC0_ACITH|nr:hypothetical protein [Acidithiobacillus thiooxidans]OCX72184.1 hypothetical protein A6M23_10340 [Acidithiobacillus thiooxidans]OCX79235.1 hypothetical protein A6P08_18285 [Acidithiobacillus thiooxidans]
MKDDELFSRFGTLLDQERMVITNGDYDALIAISNQKMELLELLQDSTLMPSNRLTWQTILQKSSENGLMVEAALRFWRGAHQKLLHAQGQMITARSDTERNAYSSYSKQEDMK